MKISEIIQKQKIDEIEYAPSNNFPVEHAQKILDNSTPIGKISNFIVNLYEEAEEKFIILTYKNKIAAFAGFAVFQTDDNWQAKNVQTYAPYKNQQLAGKIYKFVNKELGKTVLSDFRQTMSGQKLWSETLPSLGLNPKIYDIENSIVIDPKLEPSLMKNIILYTVPGDDNKNKYLLFIE